MNQNKIVIIDDDPVQTYIMKKYFSQIDMGECLEFSNGLEAINYFRKIKDVKDQPELIFLDLKMPIMNGFEFLKLYQDEVWFDGIKSRLVVLTTSLRREDRMLSYGFECVKEFLTKPISIEKLGELLTTT